MGRKLTNLNFELIDGAISIGADVKQCLYILETKGVKIDAKTLQRHIRRKFDMTYSEYRDSRMTPTKVKLVQTAIRKALEGNTVLMIFCLKNLCGWSDRVESSISPDNNTLQLKYSLGDDKQGK